MSISLNITGRHTNRWTDLKQCPPRKFIPGCKNVLEEDLINFTYPALVLVGNFEQTDGVFEL